MALFDRLRGIGDPVNGTYRLVACSYASGGATYENCTMEGVVEGPGVAPTPVHHVSLITPVSKWPDPGSVLPVTFDRQNPSRLKIRWDEVPTTAQLARAMAAQQAEAQAQAQRAAQAGAGQPAGGDPYSAGAGAPQPPYGLPQGLPPEVGAMIGDIVARAQAGGAQVTVGTTVDGVTVGGGRPAPGAVGGGLTPAETQQALAGGAAALGLVATTARVLASHEVPLPPGSPVPPGGMWDVTLDVDGGASGGWTSTLRIGFSSAARRQSVAATGRTLPVLADPARHDRIAIDTNRPI